MAGLCSGSHSLSASQACSCVKVEKLGSANLLDKIETHSASENATIKGQLSLSGLLLGRHEITLWSISDHARPKVRQRKRG